MPLIVDISEFDPVLFQVTNVCARIDQLPLVPCGRTNFINPSREGFKDTRTLESLKVRCPPDKKLPLCILYSIFKVYIYR